MNAQPEIEEEISKTQQKQMMHDLQVLGEALVNLPKAKLDQIELPEALHEAIRDAQRITAHGGKRRQLQYVGKLMRQVDPAPIHRLENWRTRLINDDAALSEFLNLHNNADVQHLRNLIRNARKEATLNKPPKSSRELFKVLREITE